MGSLKGGALSGDNGPVSFRDNPLKNQSLWGITNECG